MGRLRTSRCWLVRAYCIRRIRTLSFVGTKQDFVGVGLGKAEMDPEQNGGQGRNRTTDTRIFSPLLYQLSYLAIT